MSRPAIEKAAAVLKAGGVIVAPAEGLYGLSCVYDDDKALSRILELKRRSLKKGLIVITDTFRSALTLSEERRIPVECQMRMQDVWPGFVTCVVPAAATLSPLLTGERKTIAVRVTAFETLRELVALVGKPIVSTSANLSGETPTASLEEVQAAWGGKVDYVLPLPCQGLKGASAIYDAISGQVLRQGGSL
ncbi:MAG TPA: L-threonylcarbamoyladenylate synthase [Candidatus Avisuccinivibrio pullicola]|nr:L-threonylcarbamoyladenylate synthase [Candidatus Avisuccinivibrio pullicola]